MEMTAEDSNHLMGVCVDDLPSALISNLPAVKTETGFQNLFVPHRYQWNMSCQYNGTTLQKTESPLQERISGFRYCVAESVSTTGIHHNETNSLARKHIITPSLAKTPVVGNVSFGDALALTVFVITDARQERHLQAAQQKGFQRAEIVAIVRDFAVNDVA